MSEMKHRFKPEFLNRVDDIIMFRPLDIEGIKQIIDIFVNALRNRLKDKNIGIEVTDSAKEVMAKEGYDPVYGLSLIHIFPTLKQTIPTKKQRIITWA